LSLEQLGRVPGGFHSFTALFDHDQQTMTLPSDPMKGKEEAWLGGGSLRCFNLWVSGHGNSWGHACSHSGYLWWLKAFGFHGFFLFLFLFGFVELFLCQFSGMS